MAKIIDFNQHLLPVGTIAFHAKYRSCTVIATSGLMRKIRYMEVTEQEMQFKTAIVPASALKEHKIFAKQKLLA